MSAKSEILEQGAQMCTVGVENEKLLEFDNQVDCDAAVAIFNNGCATCETACGLEGSVWTSTFLATNGKYYCTIHPNRKTGVEGVLTYVEKERTSVDI
jgi:hypothetical protein